MYILLSVSISLPKLHTTDNNNGPEGTTSESQVISCSFAPLLLLFCSLALFVGLKDIFPTRFTLRKKMWTNIRRLSSVAILWMAFRCCNSRVDEWYPDPLNAGEWTTSTLLAKAAAVTLSTGHTDRQPSPALIQSAPAEAAVDYPISAYANEIIAQFEPSTTSVGNGSSVGSGRRMTYRYVNTGFLVATEYEGFDDCQGDVMDMIAHRLNRCMTRGVGSEMVSLMVTRNTTTKAITTQLIGHRFDDDVCQAYTSSYTISTFGHLGRCRRRRRGDHVGGSGSTSVDIVRRSDEVVVSMRSRRRSSAYQHRHQQHNDYDGGILRTMYQTSDSCQQQREKEILRFDYFHSHCRTVTNGTTSSRYHCDGGPVLLHFDTVDCQGVAYEAVPLVATCGAKHSLYYSQYTCLPAQP